MGRILDNRHTVHLKCGHCLRHKPDKKDHNNDVIMNVMASQITSLTIVYSSVFSGAVQTKHQSSASLTFVGGIHLWAVNSPHKGPETRKMFPCDDVIIKQTQRRWRLKSMADIFRLFKKHFLLANVCTFIENRSLRIQSTISQHWLR